MRAAAALGIKYQVRVLGSPPSRMAFGRLGHLKALGTKRQLSYPRGRAKDPTRKYGRRAVLSCRCVLDKGLASRYFDSMPICEIDAWRLQYFEHAKCPAEVNIPTEDSDAWQWNPKHRWVYDKIAVALSQDLAAGPHGTRPPFFPVFSKPIINLKGMGIGAGIICSDADYDRSYIPGHMWMTLLEGPHVSSDVAVVAGEARWWRHARGLPNGQGTFDYWTIYADRDEGLEARLEPWVNHHLTDYTGMVNIETIGGWIIEIHLRLTDQWPDLYGLGWVEAVVHLYDRGDWAFDDRDRQDGYSVVLFGPHGRRYRHPAHELVEGVRGMPGVSSLQISFDEHRDPSLHAMPPGGFRLAIVNCSNLNAGLIARERLRQHFLG